MSCHHLPVMCEHCIYFLENSLIMSGLMPVPVAAQSKVLVCGHSPTEIVGSNPTGGMHICLL